MSSPSIIIKDATDNEEEELHLPLPTGPTHQIAEEEELQLPLPTPVALPSTTNRREKTLAIGDSFIGIFKLLFKFANVHVQKVKGKILLIEILI